MKVKLSFDKARGLKPDETGDYVCAYDFQGNWRLASSSKELEDQEYIKQIKQLMEHEPKITQKAIADKLDISVGKVNKLIKGSKFDVEVEMTLTSPNCPVAESLPEEVRTKVDNLSGVNSCKVNIVFEPTWTVDYMSEEAKLELGML